MDSEDEPLLPSSRSPDPGTCLESRAPPPQAVYARAKARTAEVLESTPLHYLVLTLVLVDTACVLADLAYSFLSPDCAPVDGPPEPGDGGPAWLAALAALSLAINALFVAEVPATLWALGRAHYDPLAAGAPPHAALHLFDAAVVLATFVLEVVLRGKERELAGLLVVLRLWRLVKLVGGIAVGAGEIGEEQAKELEETREELKSTQAELEGVRLENQQLRLRLAQYGGQDQDGE
ncbi:uncharacterized protein BXZ73DRAFT_86207 [Epithele typhae]|uniref:uncharacterized protein n=1 Tax=Epithele typhae TaxID=378194 RepID=UPI00200816E4|nr:uncharacterized protein BXZ73DRAFT_86207 [Epithele typhae]KAH9945990.1 hypothetical protein BXZ73DRAFT_86207 [Epithele typhae]